MLPWVNVASRLKPIERDEPESESFQLICYKTFCKRNSSLDSITVQTKRIESFMKFLNCALIQIQNMQCNLMATTTTTTTTTTKHDLFGKFCGGWNLPRISSGGTRGARKAARI